ncbi:MAG: hypothetical protein ABIR33_05620 [Pyrinomonadaceae bacterium]
MNNELEHDDDDLAEDREPNTKLVREPNTEFAREPNTREPNTGVTDSDDEKA